MKRLPTITDFVAIMEVPKSWKASIMQNGHAVKVGSNLVRYSGGFCVVFPFITSSKKIAIRCWHTNVDNAQERTQKIAKVLGDVNLPYFVDFDYIPDAIAMTEGIQPIVTMDWVDALPLKDYIAEHIANPEDIKVLAENFKTMVSDLHKHNLSHGDLQHGNIMVRDDGSLVLVDYDSMYVPGLDGYTDDIQGLAGYQHPCRGKNKMLSPKVDYFSELIIYTSLQALAKIPALWTNLQIEDTETLVFTAEDIDTRGNSPIFDVIHQDSELAPMVDKLREYLQLDSIEDLLPLEDALKAPNTEMIDSIANGWKELPETPKVDTAKITDDIAQDWNKTPSTTYSPVSIKTITEEW